MIALSAYRAFNAIPKGKRAVPMTFWWIQLGLNALWSWLFFAWQRPDYALLDLALLTLFVSLTAAAFWVWDRVAALLLIPYLFWLLFALSLNAWIYLYNR